MDYPLQIPDQLAHHLRALRLAKGWSQAELGQRLGVGQSRVARTEHDPTAISVEQLWRVLAVLRPLGAEPPPSADAAEW